MMNFIFSFFNQAPIIIGLITMIGLIALKKSFSEILSGTLKTILGFIILSVEELLQERYAIHLFLHLKVPSICRV